MEDRLEQNFGKCIEGISATSLWMARENRTPFRTLHARIICNYNPWEDFTVANNFVRLFICMVPLFSYWLAMLSLISLGEVHVVKTVHQLEYLWLCWYMFEIRDWSLSVYA